MIRSMKMGFLLKWGKASPNPPPPKEGRLECWV
jgi:hypothetical protein